MRAASSSAKTRAIQGHLKDSTWSTYQGAWKKIVQCSTFTTTEELREFLDNPVAVADTFIMLVEKKLMGTSAFGSAKAAVRYMAEAYGVRNPLQDSTAAGILMNLKRRDLETSLPSSKADTFEALPLHELARRIEDTWPEADTLLKKKYKALLLTWLTRPWRGGELGKLERFDGMFGRRNSLDTVKLRLRDMKQKDQNEQTEFTITQSSRSTRCPVQAIQDYVTASAEQAEVFKQQLATKRDQVPLFIKFNKGEYGPPAPGTVTSWLKQALEVLGFDVSRIKIHSVRTVVRTRLLRAGVPELLVNVAQAKTLSLEERKRLMNGSLANYAYGDFGQNYTDVAVGLISQWTPPELESSA